MAQIKLGFAPTRRSIFSAPDAIKYRGLTAQRLRELGVDFVDIDDINEEGLLYNEDDRLKIVEKFRAAGVDGLLLAHCNFGTEYLCARLAKDLNVPVLLWGPLDERPEPDGTRLRDTQCGLFATGKVLRRFGVPFTYLTNCRLSDPVFERGVRDFLAVCNVVKTFRNIRILQIGPRPFDFWSTMCNEGELLEKFNIQLAPIPLPELTTEVKKAIAEGGEVQKTIAYCRENMDIKVSDEQLTNIAGLAVAMERLVKQYHCNAAAIQCWNALQGELGIMPCAANALLNDKGIPVVCETDIHGAVTALLVEAMTARAASLPTGPSATPISPTASSCSTAGPGRCRSRAAGPASPTPSPSTTPAPSPPRPSTATSPWPASTATTASIRSCSATPRAWTARRAWAPTSGSRSTTSSASRPRSLRARTSTTASAYTRTSSLYSTRPANTSA